MVQCTNCKNWLHLMQYQFLTLQSTDRDEKVGADNELVGIDCNQSSSLTLDITPYQSQDLFMPRHQGNEGHRKCYREVHLKTMYLLSLVGLAQTITKLVDSLQIARLCLKQEQGNKNLSPVISNFIIVAYTIKLYSSWRELARLTSFSPSQ